MPTQAVITFFIVMVNELVMDQTDPLRFNGRSKFLSITKMHNDKYIAYV